jgi:hypothetical protein
MHVFVLIDALGWELLGHHNFLTGLLPYRQPLRTVLGYSSGAIPTILTGLPPARSGRWNAFYYDPERSPFRWARHLACLPDAMLDRRVPRKLLKELGRHVLGLGPLFECCVNPRLLPWFDWVEKHNIYEPNGIPGVRTIFDRLVEECVPHRTYSYHRLTDSGILTQATADVQAGEASFFFLYLSELDHLLHYHCNDRSLIYAALDRYAAGLRQLFDSARLKDPTSCLTIVSDHGMTPVQNHYDLVTEVERRGFTMPRDYLAVYDSTMARFWFFSERAKRSICDKLAEVPCGRILTDGELNALGVLFPDRRYGQTIFLMDPSWLLSRSDFHAPSRPLQGMHGYDPADPFSDAVFLSTAPPPVPVHGIADLYQCFEAALGHGTAIAKHHAGATQ